MATARPRPTVSSGGGGGRAGVRDDVRGFFKHLRMDVWGLYLSDAEVWGRIGFPGPSVQTGGYPDFDQPQAVSLRVHSKERRVMPTITAPAPLPSVQSFLSKPGRMLIGGRWVEAAGGQTIDAIDPATGGKIGTFPAGGAADA